MLKIVFFDIDGTLKPFGSDITKKTSYAIKELQKQGILICVASGRGNTSLPPFEFVPDVYSTFNGAYCYNSKEDIFTLAMTKKDVSTIICNAKALNKSVSLSNKEILVADSLEKDLADYLKIGPEYASIVPSLDEYLKGDILKIMIAGSFNERELIIKGTKNVKIVGWWDKAFDIVHIDSGKGRGVVEILKYYGISKDEAWAFGDGDNDTEMFLEVGKSIAMANSLSSVKEKADEICDDVSKDGVYNYFVNKGIIKPME